jgi:hypothetical protein
VVAVLDAFFGIKHSSTIELSLPWVLVFLSLLAVTLWWRIYSDLGAISDLGNTQILDVVADAGTPTIS